MATKRKVTIDIDADTSDANEQIKKTTDQLGGLGKKSTETTKPPIRRRRGCDSLARRA